jgi:hypothetical protein
MQHEVIQTDYTDLKEEVEDDDDDCYVRVKINLDDGNMFLRNTGTHLSH